jgi:hypothetical protein
VREQAWLPGCRFLADTVALLGRRASLGKDPLLDAAAALPPPSTSSIEDAKQRLTEHLQTVACGKAFADIFGSTGPAERALVALEEACRGGGNFAVSCPLGPDPSTDVALWLRLVQVLSRGKLMPGMLWSDQVLLLFIGRFTPRALVALWKPGAGASDLYDLRTVRAGYSRSFPADQPLHDWLSTLK